MDLCPPQIFYLLMLLLRAAAQQAGVFLSPVDAAWEQCVPDGSRSVPVGCTIGDNSTIRTGIQCVNISDTDEEPVEQVVQAGTTPGGNGVNASPAALGPTEPPYPPPNSSRTRHRSSSPSSHKNARTKRRRK